MKRFTLSTAISYPNGAPHIGHAYELIAADAIARFKRLDGYDVHFCTGTDEHGQKMVETAEKQGITPGELADRNSALFRRMAEVLNASQDDFVSTREPRHIKASQAIWQAMADAGDIYLGQYGGWYSVRDEAFFAESELTEVDGEKKAPTGAPVAWMEEPSYFFRLSAFQERLIALYESEPDFIGPASRRNEIMSFVKGGLKDLSISRTTLKWGIPVPGDPDNVMYVWVDALTNYLTSVGYPDDTERVAKYWPADLHVIGKDIVRFHTVYWPAFLMSAGIRVPRRVFAHGFLFNAGEKMSKSVGNVLDPFDLVEAFGVDPLRHYLLREVPFGQDGNYSLEGFVSRVNADLANDIGNLAQRSLSMIAKHCDGKLPAMAPLTAADEALLASVRALPEACRKAVAVQALHTALGDIYAVVSDANRYFAGEAPWALRKTDPPRMEVVLAVTAEALRWFGILIQPFVPGTASALLGLLAVPEDARTLAALDRAPEAGTPLPAPTPIVPKLEVPVAP
ncbi:methionine--tRNA ligase [Acuticoccus sp. MNP-M23]|uniref:methionine--tRNA ligase n=1 Tax=Acuticoccus sp. MNP-M23 TaxID=3072793 RepID=UPI002814C4D0|nr:methionine--tRNA ligase [Acuticoccus sp. MNP-M23]WMS42190.1 methionine--tRNA ligase [Acuticoccus sp. MNP-M23]